MGTGTPNGTLASYGFIDLFRGLAAYGVIVAHCCIWSGWVPAGMPNSKIPVDLFMMISGFLMAANADGREAFEPLQERASRLRFWVRRFFRVAPLYYLALALVVATGSVYLAGFAHLQALNPSYWPAGGVYDPATTVLDAWNILLHVSFAFGLSPTYSFSTFLPDWSLSLEMQFYLAFPFLYLLMRRAGFVRVGLAVGVACFVAGIAIQKQVRFDEPSLLVFKLNYFIAGILIFRCLSAPGWDRRRAAEMLGALCLVSVDVRYGTDLAILPMLAAAMLGMGWLETNGRMPGALQWLVKSRVVTFASETSYGVYLFHGFFISAAGWMIHTNPSLQALAAPDRVLPMLAFVTCGAYATAYVLFRLVEKPCIAIGRELLDRRADRVATIGEAIVADLDSLDDEDDDEPVVRRI